MIVYIFENQETGEVKVVDDFLFDAGFWQKYPEKDGWSLIASLDAKVYIQSLLRDSPSLVGVLKGECL